MCYMHIEVKGKREEEYDYYLSLARLYDEGFPLIPHAHCENVLVSPAPHYDISEQCDNTPEGHAKNSVPLWVKNKSLE